MTVCDGSAQLDRGMVLAVSATVKTCRMYLLDQIAETRIQEAIERGELRDLPGEGEPLQLDDDSAIPEELRAAYRILKNAGFLPPELQLRKELHEAEQLLQQLPEGERNRARVRLELLQLRLAASRRRPINLLLEDCYCQRLLERLDPSVSRES